MRILVAAVLVFTATSITFGQGFSPDAAVARMRLPDGFAAKLVVAEPLIRQPLSISFDSRGRLWVLQYLQYPNPAGLKPLQQDQYLRTVWDRVPEPPPHGPKGLDRLTILSDPNADGIYTKSKDFVSGLNLATGFCIGSGGVYIVQPPYLLFYPDKNDDDIPDSDPEVCLTGFGMEDTHSYANSLQWGPDGWLYGAHGSTVTAKIKNPIRPSDPPVEFQQGIWRYHPKTKEFELFSEGGGNTYGLDFDAHGQAIAGTNFGGFAMLHQMQGAYHVKGFSKHGPLHNPYTFGYFDHVPYTGFQGGHVTCGGIVYQADAYPKEYHNQYIAGNLLSNAVYMHTMESNGSTFKARHGADLLIANDTWFRPVDCTLGPDGSVYVADWYDKRAAHLDPVDSWDKTNGRVYKIEYRGTKPLPAFDLRTKTPMELVGLLKHPNVWWRREARQLLGERKGVRVVEALTELIDANGSAALDAFWTRYAISGLDDATAEKYLGHDNPDIRAWVVRLLGDRPKTRREFPPYSPPGADVSPELVSRMIELAGRENSLVVRAQLACTAKRLDRTPGLQLAAALTNREADLSDPFLPNLVWWAIEPHFQIPALAYQKFKLPTSPGWRDFLVERMARRTAASDVMTAESLDARSQPEPPEQRRNRLSNTTTYATSVPEPALPAAFRGIETALDGRTFDRLLPEMDHWLTALHAKAPLDPSLFRIRLRFDHGDALAIAHQRAQDAQRTDAERIAVIRLLGQVHRTSTLPVLLKLFTEPGSESVRVAAVSAAQGYADPTADALFVAAVPTLTGKLRTSVLTALVARPTTASAMLRLVDAGTIPPTAIALDLVRVAVAHNDLRITKLVEKHYGKLGPATPGEKLARIASLNIALGRDGRGDPVRGKVLFAKHCSACHTFHGDGGKVGPDLTTADRKNRHYMLTQIVDPSGYVRPEFVAYRVDTVDGRTLTGLVAPATGDSITIVNVVDNREVRTLLGPKAIERIVPSPVSLMPEKLLDTFSDGEVTDLFAFLASDPPKVPAAKPAGEKKLKVALVSGSLEYRSDDSMLLLQQYLESKFAVTCVRLFRKSDADIPSLEKLADCDAAIFFTRRLTIDGDQLAAVKAFVDSGKPIVGIRTASHGFQKWLEMDKLVYGGDYKNHYGVGPKCEVTIAEAGKSHPVLTGVMPYASTGSLYKNPMLAANVTVLLTGSIPMHAEPVAWVRERLLPGGKTQRVFYTSLGHPDDFAAANFLKLLSNGLLWAVGKDVPK